MMATRSIPEISETTLERFWKKIKKTKTCWKWRGARDHHGYGRFAVHRMLRIAHRVSWRISMGDPNGLYVLHHCDNPACVRPSHLFLGDQTDNMRDASRKGRLHGERPHLRKSHCPRGHPYNKKNSYISPSGDKFCRTCHRYSENRRSRRSGSRPWSCRICDICKRKAKGRGLCGKHLARLKSQGDPYLVSDSLGSLTRLDS